MKSEKIAYSHAGVELEGELVWDEAAQAPQPLLLVAPNWAGMTPRAIEMGRELAICGYVAFVVDMYGPTRRPKGTEVPQEFLKPYMTDAPLTRGRMNAALDAMTRAARERGIGNPKLRAAIGYCFGGANVLELARSGADVAAVVSMHGDLGTPMPAKSGEVKAAVLVVHGAEDPVAPKSQRHALEEEMTAAGARWTMLTFGGVYHSFTDPNANRPPFAQFSAHANRQGFSLAHAFIADAFQGKI